MTPFHLSTPYRPVRSPRTVTPYDAPEYGIGIGVGSPASLSGKAEISSQVRH